MTTSRTYQVTALVLRSREYGEGHRLISLLTREAGKILAVAKGVMKPKAKLASALQHFTLGEMQLARGKRFDIITQVRVLEPFYGLRSDLAAVAYASYFAELFDELLEEHQHQSAAFDLLDSALRQLVAGVSPDLLARFVEIHAIALAGYLPHLTQCAHCACALSSPAEDGSRAWPTWLGFSASQGGAICVRCLSMVPGAKRIAAGTVQVAKFLLTHSVEAISAVKISDRLRREVESTLRDYLEYRLERRLLSARFLHMMAATRGSDETNYACELTGTFTCEHEELEP